MEVEELKSIYQKSNKELDNKNIEFNSGIIHSKCWFLKHRNAIEGTICIITSIIILIFVFGKIQKSDIISLNTLIVCIAGGIIALYPFTKGVFTILFHFKEKQWEYSVNYMIHTRLINQLYFVYERMFWLWILLPLVLIALPFIAVNWIIMPEGTAITYCMTAGIIYLTTLIVLSKWLWKKRKAIISRIKDIENEK